MRAGWLRAQGGCCPLKVCACSPVCTLGPLAFGSGGNVSPLNSLTARPSLAHRMNDALGTQRSALGAFSSARLKPLKTIMSTCP